MSLEVVAFWVLALTLIVSALGVVLTRNPFHSVLWLALGGLPAAVAVRICSTPENTPSAVATEHPVEALLSVSRRTLT